MELSDIMARDGVFAQLRAGSKKQVLQALATRAADLTGQSERDIFDVLLKRERLGSTGIGNGVAIPHGKLPDLDGVTAIFAQLEKPIDFDAMDDEPVDLVFMLLAPEGSGATHLKALSRIARVMRDHSLLTSLRSIEDRDALHDVLTTSRPVAA